MVGVTMILPTPPQLLIHYVREMAKVEGGLAMIADSGCTFSCFTKLIGRIDGTHLDSVVPVTIGDGSTLRFPGTDLYCATMGGQGTATYDVLFRAGTSGMGNGSVLSEIMLRTVFNVRSILREKVSAMIYPATSH